MIWLLWLAAALALAGFLLGAAFVVAIFAAVMGEAPDPLDFDEEFTPWSR